MKSPRDKLKERPAESAGGIGAAVAAVGALLGLDAETVAKIAVVAAVLPAVVTYLVELRRRLRARG